MRYSFADCVLDTQLYTLSRAGTTCPLRPKVFQVLVYLLTHRDHVVSREELCAQVWPGQFISETTLESCIKRTRQAIGDSGHMQQLIQTRRGYGYRFIGMVEVYPDPPTGAASAGVLASLRPPSTLSQAAHALVPGPSPQGTAGREILVENVVSLTGKQRYERFGLPCVAAVWSRVYLVMSLTQEGAFAEGHSLGTEAVQIAEAVNHPYSLMVAYYGIGFLSLRQGHLPEATAMLEHGLAVCHAGHVRSWLPVLTASVGYAYALAGRLAEGLPLLEQAVEQDTARGWGRCRAMLCGYLGMAYLWAGRLTEARSLVQQAIDIARQEKSPAGEAAALYHLGALARRGKSPQLELAEARYRQALALAEKLAMRPLIAHCHLSLGTLYCQMERQEQACTALSTAIDLYRAMDMIFWLPQAEAALAQVRTCSNAMAG